MFIPFCKYMKTFYCLIFRYVMQKYSSRKKIIRKPLYYIFLIISFVKKCIYIELLVFYFPISIIIWRQWLTKHISTNCKIVIHLFHRRKICQDVETSRLNQNIQVTDASSRFERLRALNSLALPQA